MQHETTGNENEEKFETKIEIEITKDKHQVKNNDEIKIIDKIQNKQEKYSNFNKFDEKEDNPNFYDTDINREVRIVMKYKLIESPDELFEFVIRSSKSESKSKLNPNLNSNSKMKTIFINEIKRFIEIMNEILYTPQYSILFEYFTKPPKGYYLLENQY